MHNWAKAAQSPVVWGCIAVAGRWKVALGGSCRGCFSSLHIYLLAAVFPADKTEVCGKHLLIQSENGDGNWGTRGLHFPLWPSLNLNTSYGARHPGSSVQKDSKSQNMEDAVIFSLKAQAQHFTNTQYQHFRVASMVR